MNVFRNLGLALLVAATLTYCNKDGDDALLLPVAALANQGEAGGPGASPADAGQNDPVAPTGQPVVELDTGSNAGGGASGTPGGTAADSGSDNTGSAAGGSGTTDGGSGTEVSGSGDVDDDGGDLDAVDDAEDPADGLADADGTEDPADEDDVADAGSGDDGSTVADSGPEKACKERSIALDTSKGRWFVTGEAELNGRPSKEERAELKKQIKALQKEIKGLSKGDKAAKAALQAQVRTLREKYGHGHKQKGIHTYWANEKLYLRVKNNCQPGWYRLRVVAKNISGPLPDFYKMFNISAHNETNNVPLGGLFVKASDKNYKRGRMLVYLAEGDTDLRLLWTNDAYEKGVYDANIQIRGITLKYKAKVKLRTKMTRKAHQYCHTNGTWFWDNNTARTYWKNQTIGFCFNGLAAGKYEVEVAAKNYGKVPAGYKAFEVMVAGDGVADQTSIDANEKAFKKGKAVLDLRGGNVMVALTWLNDRYVPEKGEDANIQIKKIRLKRIGDSQRSAFVGYIRNIASGNGMVLLGVIGLALLGLAATFLLGRSRSVQ